MRFLSALAIAVILTPQGATACEFASKDGWVIEFLSVPEGQIPQNAPNDDAGAYGFPYTYAVVDGRKCDFTETTFICGRKTTPITANSGLSFRWNGRLYETTDNCSTGPE